MLIEKWNCCQKALVNALMRCEGRAVLYSPVVRCQSLTKPMPLYCELYSASLFLPTWVEQDGQCGPEFGIIIPLSPRRRLELA